MAISYQYIVLAEYHWLPKAQAWDSDPQSLVNTDETNETQ